MEKEMEIKLLILITGERILIQLKEINDVETVIVNPLIMVPNVDKQGKHTIDIVPWLGKGIQDKDQEFEIPKQAIIAKTVPNERLLEHYQNIVNPKRIITNVAQPVDKKFIEDINKKAQHAPGSPKLKITKNN